jgi:hypothetical protein
VQFQNTEDKEKIPQAARKKKVGCKWAQPKYFKLDIKGRILSKF